MLRSPPSGARATRMGARSVRPQGVRRHGHHGGPEGELSDQEFELNREIIEAIKQIEREKGIDAETLLVALEDALLAAYKKTPDAAEHARVEIDRDSGDIRVFQLLPPDGEALRTLPQPEFEIPEGVDPEEFEPPEPEIDWDAYADE